MIRKRTTLTTSEKKRLLFYLLFGTILLGVGGGAAMLFWQDPGVSLQWTTFMGMFFQVDFSAPDLFREAVGGAVLFLFCIFLSGFSAIGQVFVLFLLLTFGVCMGGAMQVQCAEGSFILRCLLLMLYFVPVSLLLAVAARESIRFASCFSAYGFRDEPGDQMPHRFRMYCTRFVVLLLFLFAAALCYSLLFYTAQPIISGI